LQLVHVLCSGIVECKDLQRMLSILHDSSSLLLFLETKYICDRNLAENDALFSALHAFAKNARDSNWTPHAVRDIFWNRGYAQFSETLLSGISLITVLTCVALGRPLGGLPDPSPKGFDKKKLAGCRSCCSSLASSVASWYTTVPFIRLLV